MLMQLLLFPGLFFSGWAYAGFDTSTEHGLFPEPDRPGYLLMRCFLYCFAGHLLGDCYVERARPGSLIMTHHIACLVGVAAFLTDPYGGPLLAAGPVVLELGSLVLTMWCADLVFRTCPAYAGIPWPRGKGPLGRALVPWLYYVVHTASNIIAAAALGVVVWANAVHGVRTWPYAALYAIVGLILLPLRQQQLIDVALGKVERPTLESTTAEASPLTDTLLSRTGGGI